MTRQEAQRRADRIRLFREELAELEREGHWRFPANRRAGLTGTWKPCFRGSRRSSTST